MPKRPSRTVLCECVTSQQFSRQPYTAQQRPHTHILPATAWVAISSIQLMPKRPDRRLLDRQTINLHLQYTLRASDVGPTNQLQDTLRGDDCSCISDSAENSQRPAECTTLASLPVCHRYLPTPDACTTTHHVGYRAGISLSLPGRT